MSTPEEVLVVYTDGSKCVLSEEAPACYFVKFENTKSEPEYVSIDQHKYIVLQKEDYYTLNFEVKIKFPCPIATTKASIYDLTNSVDIVSKTVHNNETVLLQISSIFPAGLILGIKITEKCICRIKVSGNITRTEIFDELTAVTDFDQSLKIRYIPNRPAGLPNPPYPPQYQPATTYPWISNTIPAAVLTGPVPPTLPNADGYAKFQSVQYSIGFYLGLDMATINPADPQLSVFLTNLDNRGPDNYRKKVYMSALTCNILSNYDEKINSFLNEIYADFVTYSRPVLSSFKNALIKFFLAIHLGYDDYPDYVVEYFRVFVDIIGFGDPNRPGRDEAMIWGNQNVPKVREYFKQRNDIINAEADEKTIMYHWHLAGLAPEGLVMEAIHNIIAFSQYNNVLFLVINDKYNGTPVPFPPGSISYDFFTKFSAAGTQTDQLNVIRELYRLLVPNSTSFSRVIQEVADVPPVTIQGRHVHKSIMASSFAYLNAGNPLPYFTYNTSLYSSFDTDFSQCSCPVVMPTPVDNFNPETGFVVSPVDSETLLDICNPKMIPVFPVPLYAPFGLGYRRCPGEELNYYITIKLMEKIKDLTFEFIPITPSTPVVTVAPFTAVPDNIYYKP